ncbi:MAG: chemotaxis protein CheD [Aureliella sp.]
MSISRNPTNLHDICAEQPKTLHVHIGEVKIAKRQEHLKAILGSCVGIGLIWRQEKKCGLAHCLLPSAPEKSCEIGGRFVDQAIRSLVALMKIKKSDVADVHAIVAGGGNMTSFLTSRRRPMIGEANFQAAVSGLKQIGMRIVHADGGGELGRQLTVDAQRFTYDVQFISRLPIQKKDSR